MEHPFFFCRQQETRQSMRYILGITFLFSIFFLTSATAVWGAGSLSPWSEDAIALMNRERTDRGLPPLIQNDSLTTAASAKLKDMERKRYFAHTSPEKRTPWSFIEAAGYEYRFAGENLAIHFKDPGSEHVAWMRSEKHCQNILDPRFREVGVAVGKIFFEGRETMLVVSMFGTKSQEVIDPGATKEVALALCRGEDSLVAGAAADAPEDGSVGPAALFVKAISMKYDSLWHLIAESPHDTAQILATVLFAGAQVSAVVLVLGGVLAREHRDGLFPS